MNMGTIIQKIIELPEPNRSKLLQVIKITEQSKASPAGAILVGMHLLEKLGVTKLIDECLGEENKTISEMKKEYNSSQGRKDRKPPVPSTGAILSLLISDMIARPKNLIRLYQVREIAEEWQTKSLLGISPNVLTDDRLAEYMTKLGADSKVMDEILYLLTIKVSQKFNIPLSRFFIDTSVLQLDGSFNNAGKVTAGRGRDSLSQLVVSLAIAQGSRIPVGLAVCAGNTFDGDTLKHSFESINRIAPQGPVELIMDRIFPTPSNISYLNGQREIRECNWVSPLKIGLSEKAFKELVETAYENNLWEQLDYRSAKDIKAKKEPELKAFETNWTLTQKIVPDLEEGQSRRPKGSIKTIEIIVRCVVYRDEEKARLEKATRIRNLEKLENALEEFKSKLNKYKYKTIDGATKGLETLLGKYSKYKRFMGIILKENDNTSICLEWNKNEALIKEEEEKFDGIFALLTNYEKEKVSANKLIAKYRERNEVEMNFRDLKGILDLERVFMQKQERIDCYIFLKSLAYFVLAFLRWYAEDQKFSKTTERNIQETLGEMCIVENKIMPIEISIYSVGNMSELSEWIKEAFELNNPIEEIEELNLIELAKVSSHLEKWIEEQKHTENSNNN